LICRPSCFSFGRVARVTHQPRRRKIEDGIAFMLYDVRQLMMQQL